MFRLTMNENDPIAPDVARLVQLFSAQPELKFADLDGRILHEAAAKVKERHQALLEAEAALAAAHAALDEESEALLRHAHRAHAYLRVYAESDPALLERVDAISLPRGRRAPRLDASPATDGQPTPPRKPRSRRVASTDAGLFPPAEASSAP
jgi:hypothetical protein